MKIAVIDNYDSFTYNLVNQVGEIAGCRVDVFRNDEIKPEECEKYDRLILSPGPGLPSEAGRLKDIIEHMAGKTKMLGICLGLQAIAEVFGGTLNNLSEVIHGMATDINVNDYDEQLFIGLPSRFRGGRYHSWVVSPDNFPSSLKITARDTSGNIMAAAHKTLDIKGLQFHPESVLTTEGNIIMANWLGISPAALDKIGVTPGYRPQIKNR